MPRTSSTSYFVATLEQSEDADLAADWVAWVTSEEGQAILGRRRLRQPVRDRLGRPPALLMVPAVLATLLLLVPLVAMVASTDWQALPGHLTSRAAVDALRLSLVTSTVAIVFCLLLGLPLAWLLARVDFRGRGAVRALVTVPLVLPPVVAGVALRSAFGRTGAHR